MTYIRAVFGRPNTDEAASSYDKLTRYSRTDKYETPKEVTVKEATGEKKYQATSHETEYSRNKDGSYSKTESEYYETANNGKKSIVTSTTTLSEIDALKEIKDANKVRNPEVHLTEYDREGATMLSTRPSRDLKTTVNEYIDERLGATSGKGRENFFEKAKDKVSGFFHGKKHKHKEPEYNAGDKEFHEGAYGADYEDQDPWEKTQRTMGKVGRAVAFGGVGFAVGGPVGAIVGAGGSLVGGNLINKIKHETAHEQDIKNRLENVDVVDGNKHETLKEYLGHNHNKQLTKDIGKLMDVIDGKGDATRFSVFHMRSQKKFDKALNHVIEDLKDMGIKVSEEDLKNYIKDGKGQFKPTDLTVAAAEQFNKDEGRAK